MFVRKVSSLHSFVEQKEKCFSFVVTVESQGKTVPKNYCAGPLILSGEPSAAGRTKDKMLIRVL